MNLAAVPFVALMNEQMFSDFISVSSCHLQRHDHVFHSTAVAGVNQFSFKVIKADAENTASFCASIELLFCVFDRDGSHFFLQLDPPIGKGMPSLAMVLLGVEEVRFGKMQKNDKNTGLT